MKKIGKVILALFIALLLCGLVKSGNVQNTAKTNAIEPAKAVLENKTNAISLETSRNQKGIIEKETNTIIASEVFETTESQVEPQEEAGFRNASLNHETEETSPYHFRELNSDMQASEVVNVRSTPSTEGDVLGQLFGGQTVRVTGQCAENDWYRIEFSTGVGYIRNDLLTDAINVAEEPTRSSNPFTIREMAATKYAQTAVNIRSAPSTDGEILGRFDTNQTVSITGQCSENGWYRVALQNGEGFVSCDYVADEKVQESRGNAVAGAIGAASSSGGVIVPTESNTNGENLVWVPIHGGKKFHKAATCSSMRDPKQIPMEEAINRGYDYCKKCYG